MSDAGGRRVRASDRESAELADVALAGLGVLIQAWELEGDRNVVRFWKRVRMAIEVRPVADLEPALNAARGLRDLYRLFPYLDRDMTEVAEKIERRAWQRERARLGIPGPA